MELTQEQIRIGAEVIGVTLIVLENILPHLPTRANSTVQLVITILKAIALKKRQ